MSAGTTQDTSVRLVADRLTQSLGRSFIVDNMPGGRGLIAAQTAARAEPDGYTYFLGGVGVIASDRHLFKSLPYNPDRDFVPVAMIYDAAAFVVAVHPDLPAKSVPELQQLGPDDAGRGGRKDASAVHDYRGRRAVPQGRKAARSRSVFNQTVSGFFIFSQSDDRPAMETRVEREICLLLGLSGCRDGPRLLNETRSLADKIFIISNYYTPSPYVFMHKR